MKIKKIMQKAVFIKPGARKLEILKIIKKHPNLPVFVVVDKNSKFLGDIHENDFFYMLLPNEKYGDIGVELAFDIEKKFFATKASEIIRNHDVHCYEDDDMMDVAVKFAGEEVNEMPVLNKKEQVVGVITQGIILRHLNL